MFICYAIYSVKRLFQYAIGMVMLGKREKWGQLPIFCA